MIKVKHFVLLGQRRPQVLLVLPSCRSARKFTASCCALIWQMRFKLCAVSQWWWQTHTTAECFKKSVDDDDDDDDEKGEEKESLVS